MNFVMSPSPEIPKPVSRYGKGVPQPVFSYGPPPRRVGQLYTCSGVENRWLMSCQRCGELNGSPAPSLKELSSSMKFIVVKIQPPDWFLPNPRSGSPAQSQPQPPDGKKPMTSWWLWHARPSCRRLLAHF